MEIKSFKEFIAEAPFVDLDMPHVKRDTFMQKSDNWDHHSTMDSGHKVVVRRFNDNQTTFHVKNKSGKSIVSVKALENGKDLVIQDLNKTEDSDVKSHDIYHHLITKHGYNIYSDHYQSVGGMKVWQKLAKKPGINMRVYSDKSKKTKPLPKNFDTDYVKDKKHPSTRLLATKAQ